MADRLLVLDGVCKAFGRGVRSLPVLRDVSLRVDAGEVVTVVGTRDQGKTTLLRIAAGTLPPDQGAVHLLGRELGSFGDRELSQMLRSQIGLATRGGPSVRVRVGDYLGVRLAAGLRLRGAERRRTVLRALEAVDVADCIGMSWRDLSSWERVRVELAQAIVGRPRLLLVDDLLDGIGLGKKQAAMELLRGLVEELGCGVLMTASDHAAALSSDRVCRLDEGRLKLMADLGDPDLIPLRKGVGAGRRSEGGGRDRTAVFRDVADL